MRCNTWKLVHLTQLSQFLVPFMPAHRIVQDSDDSDGDISDLATSIDPLQDRSPQCFAATGSARCPRQPDEHSLSLCGSDPSMAVNFDNFLSSQDHRAQMSASLQESEALWLRESRGEDLVGEYLDRFPEHLSVVVTILNAFWPLLQEL